jgi:pseudouridine synthase
MADAGVASRRECEELVVAGAVTVNGKVVDRLPAWVDPAGDRIEVYGRPLRKAEKHVYVMLFKPRGTVCTNSDPEGRPRAIDLVQHPSRPRLYCVGRLDLDSSGLLILTNDGEFANRLTHPRYLVEKGYDLTVDGSLDERAIAALERSIFAAESGRHAAPTRSSLRLVSRDRDKTVMHLTLCEHRNLQIRPLMLELGHPVNKLRRTSFGPLRLKGLAVGEWRDLTPREVEQLLRAAKAEDPGARRAPRAPKRSMVELAVAREERALRLASTEGDAPAAATKPSVKKAPRDTPAPQRRSERGSGARGAAGKTKGPNGASRGGRPTKPKRPGPRGRRSR